MFALRTPASAGVSIGPFRATRHDRIVSSVPDGRGSPCRAKDRAPISAGTHSKRDAGGIDRPARRLDHLGPDAVAGDERDPVGSHDGGQGTGPTILGA